MPFTVFIEKESVCKWTHAVQTGGGQESTVFCFLYQPLKKMPFFPTLPHSLCVRLLELPLR